MSNAIGRVRRWTSGLFAGALALIALAAPASAAPTFPALSGRVVDQAGALLPSTRESLTWRLKALEQNTGDQLAVAVVSSLEGLSVEDYANRLFLQWRLGDKDRNNGVLLLLVMNDHKLRVEVATASKARCPTRSPSSSSRRRWCRRCAPATPMPRSSPASTRSPTS